MKHLPLFICVTIYISTMFVSGCSETIVEEYVPKIVKPVEQSNKEKQLKERWTNGELGGQSKEENIDD